MDWICKAPSLATSQGGDLFGVGSLVSSNDRLDAHLISVCSSISEAADRAYAYVIWTTKAIPELSRSTDLLAPFLSPSYNNKFPQPTYVNMQNGLNVEVDLYKALQALNPHEEPKIIGTAVYVVANARGNNSVEHCNHMVSDTI